MVKKKTSNFNKSFSGLFAFGMLLTILMSTSLAILPKHVSAAATATWVNASTISYNGQNYKEDDATDNNWHFYGKSSDGCKTEIKGFDYSPYDGPFKTQNVTLYKKKKIPGGCASDGTASITLKAQPPGYEIEFTWIDAGKIQSTDGKKTFDLDSDTGTFVSANDQNGCKDYLSVGSSRSSLTLVVRSNVGSFADKATDSLRRKYGGSNSGWEFINRISSKGDVNINGDDCHESKPVSVRADANESNKPKGEGTPIGEGSSSATGANENTCENTSGALGWIMCPVINMLDGVFNWLDTQIQALLEVNQDMYKDPDLKNAWGNIRNIAYIILIPVMLVMVIGTALNFSFLDAYTVKKALPRMVAAIIFIALSWTIVTFIIGFFNVIGTGVLGLLTQPFGVGGNATLGNLFKPSAGGAVVSWAGIGATIAAFTIPGVAGIALSYVASGVLALGIAWLVLVARQLFILLFALLAPLAILAWIFPGNDKMWKTWWNTFTKLLIMFPLITGLIASGRIFAYLIGNTPSGGLQGGIINPILKITAYIIPYLFIPFTFKFAGGVFANLAGIVNDRGRGAFDRLKKFRQGEAKKIGERAQAGNLYKDKAADSRLGRFNTMVQKGTLLPAGGLTLSRQKRLDRMESARSRKNFDLATEAMQNDAAFGAIKGDDDKLWAMMNGKNEAGVRAELLARAPGRFKGNEAALNLAVQDVMHAKKSLGENVGRIAATRAQAGTGTGYNYNPAFQNGEDDMLNAIIAASGNDRGLAGRMLAEMRGAASQSGRVDLSGGGFAVQAKTMDMRRQAIASADGMTYATNERGQAIDASGNVVDDLSQAQKIRFNEADARKVILQDVLNSNAGAAVAGKKRAVEELAPVMLENVSDAVGSGNVDTAARELAKIAGKYDAASQVAPQNAEVLANEVLSKEIDVSQLSPELRQALDSQITKYEIKEVQVPDPDTGEVKVERRQVPVSSQRTITYQQAIEALRGNPNFQLMRREYQTAGVAAADAAARQQPGGGLPDPTAGPR